LDALTTLRRVTGGTDSPLAPHAATPAELRERIEAERRGDPFLVFRDGDGAQRLVVLDAERGRATIGRSQGNDVALHWDTEVSRLHAELERLGDEWTVSDDGLSRNGSFVNGDRLVGRRRLHDGDVMRFGDTLIAYVEPKRGESRVTDSQDESPLATQVSEAQRRVLVALCRPYKDSGGFAAPASNKQIADELVLSLRTVENYLHRVYEKLGINGRSELGAALKEYSPPPFNDGGSSASPELVRARR
jgi:pSer/pThr/pTyr-binding forkhead associated (FHA) protein